MNHELTHLRTTDTSVGMSSHQYLGDVKLEMKPALFTIIVVMVYLAWLVVSYNSNSINTFNSASYNFVSFISCVSSVSSESSVDGDSLLICQHFGSSCMYAI